MSEFKGTKGEFSYKGNTLEGRQKSYDILVEEEMGWGKWIASVHHANLIEATEEEVLANAKLFVAAKDLLEALVSLVKGIEEFDSASDDMNLQYYFETNIIEAKQAIKKALGNDK